MQTTQKLDISDLNEEELDILERALQKAKAASGAPFGGPERVLYQRPL
jgi:hypothetical protein